MNEETGHGQASYCEICEILKTNYDIKKETIRAKSFSGLCTHTEHTILLDGIRVWVYCFSCSGLPSSYVVCYTNNNTTSTQQETYYSKKGKWPKTIFKLVDMYMQECGGIQK